MYLGATTCTITIADTYVLRGVHSIEIKKSVHQIIQTAKVQLPLSVVFRNSDNLLQRIKLSDKIKEGDSIKLEFGYDGKNRLEFEGYIRRIGDEMPLELTCEDELYRFRKVRFKESFKEISLKKIVELVLRSYEQQFDKKIAVYEAMPEMGFKKFQIRDANGIEVLQELKEKYGLNSFLTKIKGVDTLYVGLAYSLQKQSVKLLLGRNTIGKGELKYTGAEDKKLKVTVINYRKDGTIKKLEFGDKGGDEKKLELHGDLDQRFLENMAKKELLTTSTKSYKGSFETFLTIITEPGTVVKMTDPQFSGRGGAYYIGTVTTTFGVSSRRRKNEIDIKVSTQ